MNPRTVQKRTQLGDVLGVPPLPFPNRLSVYILNDLSLNCPKTILAMESWIDHVGFWLAELATHLRTKEQLPYMIGLLALRMAAVMGCSVGEARQCLKDEMVLQQIKRVMA